MSYTIRNGTRSGSRPEEYFVIEGLDQILKSPTILETYIPGMKRSLITYPDLFAINGDRNTFRSSVENDRMLTCSLKSQRCTTKVTRPTDALDIALIGEVIKIWAKRFELRKCKWQDSYSKSVIATMSVGQ